MASNSILKLQVDDKQYEASLKNAQQGLTALQAALRKSGKSFADVDKQTEQYVRELGKMEATVKTTRGRIGEMSSAFVELSRIEKQLTDQERQSPVGKALTESLAQLKQRTIDAKNELQGLENQIKNVGEVKLPDTGGLFGGGKLDGMLQVFGGNLMTKGLELATSSVSSLASEIGGMITQGVELARQGEGIRIAFERLGRGDILDGLREATHGTVTDLELMKAAVKFNDFKLPVEELGTMLAFAQQKAKDTGQSVDYMVDSIVTGLGRKSLMILDNLGLSANEIKEKMKQTGDMTKAVGQIIREQMAKAGDYVETAADRAARANVDLQNKMEELGRKFAPVEEASNQLWTSMKLGILDVVGGPLARLLNGLTEAGRLKNTLNDLNGGGNGQESTTEKALRILREYSGGGRGIEGKRDLYNRQVASFNKQEAEAWSEVNRLRKGLNGLLRVQEKNGNAGYLQPKISEISRQMEEAENRAKVFRIMRAEYEVGAKQILSPVKPVIDTSGAEQSIASLTKKLKDLQEQRKKAIAAGDTELSKNLAKQITQTKADIKGLGGSVSTSATHKATPQERAADKVSEAERTYAETLLKNSIRLEAGLDSTLDNKKKELSAQERLFDAYNDAYATYKDPAYKESSRQAAEKIKQLAEEVKTLTDAHEASKKTARELESAQKKLADAQKKLADAQATGSATAVYKAQKEVNKQQDVVNRLQDPSLPVPAKPTGFEAYKQSIQAEIKFGQMQVDENTLHSLLQTALKNGLNGLTVDYSGLQDRIAKGIDIPDSTWKALQEEINAKLKDIGIDPIEINFKTGGIDKVNTSVAALAKSTQQAGSVMNTLGGALASLEDPSAKVAGIVAQAVANMALSYSQASKEAAEAGGGWPWIAFAATGAATMISSIAAIKSATAGKYAEGGIVPGNNYSDGLIAHVSSGELILNKSQQNTLANHLSANNGGNMSGGTTRVSGEQIYIALNNYLRRSGHGEMVTWG